MSSANRTTILQLETPETTKRGKALRAVGLVLMAIIAYVILAALIMATWNYAVVAVAPNTFVAMDYPTALVLTLFFIFLGSALFQLNWLSWLLPWMNKDKFGLRG